MKNFRADNQEPPQEPIDPYPIVDPPVPQPEPVPPDPIPDPLPTPNPEPFPIPPEPVPVYPLTMILTF